MPDDGLVGCTARLAFEVKQEDLASVLGSGEVPVLATPRMIAWMEAATVAAVAAQMKPGATTVGTAVEIDHVAASPVGTKVMVSATVCSVDGKTVAFDCEAVADDASSEPLMIGHGSISRVVVDRAKFLARLVR